MLVYKASQAGKQVIEIDPENTSQDCSNPKCDNRIEKDLSERTHKCNECGLEIDRDLNASLNIVNRAIELVGAGTAQNRALGHQGASGGTIPLSRVVEQGSHVL